MNELIWHVVIGINSFGRPFALSKHSIVSRAVQEATKQLDTIGSRYTIEIVTMPQNIVIWRNGSSDLLY